MPPPNPATRLHAILAAVNAERGGTPAVQVWAKVLDAPAEQPDLFFARIAEVAALVAQVRALVEGLPEAENPAVVLRNYDQVEGTVARFVHLAGMNMSQFLEPLKDTGLFCVEMAGLALRRNGYREPQLEQAQIDELRDEVHDLVGDVLGADGLTPDEKRSIVGHLQAVEETLTAAFLSGDDLSQETHGLVGALVSLAPRAWESPAIRQVAKFSTAVMMAVAVNLGTQVAENAVECPKPPAVVFINQVMGGSEVPAITSGQASDEVDVVDAELIEEGSPASSASSSP